MAKKEQEVPDFNPDTMEKQDFQEIVSDTQPPELGEFVKFEVVGDSLSGVYERNRKYTSQMAGEQTLYDIRTPDGLFTITGNWDLNEKMKKLRSGSFIRVTYVDDKPMAREGFSPMRIYRVEVSRSSVTPEGVTRKSPLKRNPDFNRG